MVVFHSYDITRGYLRRLGVVCEVGCMIHRAKKQLQKMTEEWRRQDEAAASSAAEPAAIGAKEEEVGL